MKTRALVFEDNDFLRAMIKDFLAQRGYDVVLHHDPAECPVLKPGSPPPSATEILISGLAVPNMSGLKFVERHTREGRRIDNVAFVANDWSPEEVAYAKKLGCKVLKKPLKFNELGVWLNECEKRSAPPPSA